VGEATEPSDAVDLCAEIQAARGGSSQAIGELLESCRNYLLMVANAEVPNEVRPKLAASDLVQQSVAEAWQAFDQFHGQNSCELLRWLRCILLNNLRDAKRRYCDAEKRNAAREICLPDGSRDEGAEAFGSLDPTPSAIAMANEEFTLIHAALARLPAHYAQVVRLRNLEYLPFSEISVRMQLELHLVRKLWERAIKRLSKELRTTS